MTELLDRRLQALHQAQATPTLRRMRRGIEKESLRITPQGGLAPTPHPAALGAALTHPYLTTDYSEALLEFITPASAEPEEPLAFLDQLHRFVYAHIGDERLWVNSMPCLMTDDDADIPLADYGRSNVGQMKHIYRRGLGYRYGRRMQTIAGIHYNLSFPQEFWTLHQSLEQAGGDTQAFISDRYMDLTRNFQRYSWLLVYLFGASPALCKSFLAGREHVLEEMFRGTLARPHATSLRMSDLGYQNNAQSGLHVSYNTVAEYVETLTRAIKTEAPEYRQIGVQVNGEWRQLNANVLQIENEYYSSIRPKRTPQSGERPSLALLRRGVEYVEIRTLDLNPFEPLGLNLTQTRFLDVFATWCLLRASPPLDATDLRECKKNIRQVVYEGRDPQVRLCNRGDSTLLTEWALRTLDQLDRVAALLDQAWEHDGYSRAVADQRQKILDPSLTPSAQVLDTLSARNQPFMLFALEQAERHREHFLSQPADTDTSERLSRLALSSLAEQAEWEAAPQPSFEDYLAAYFRD